MSGEVRRCGEVAAAVAERESLLTASTQPTWPDVTGLAQLR